MTERAAARPSFQQLLPHSWPPSGVPATPREDNTGLACWHSFSPEKRAQTEKEEPIAMFSPFIVWFLKLIYMANVRAKGTTFPGNKVLSTGKADMVIFIPQTSTPLPSWTNNIEIWLLSRSYNNFLSLMVWIWRWIQSCIYRCIFLIVFSTFDFVHIFLPRFWHTLLL